MRVLAIVPIVMVVACGGKPVVAPARPYEPRVVVAPDWMRDEQSVFDFVKQRYESRGLGGLFEGVELVVDEKVILPFYVPADHKIHTTPFARDLVGMRTHLATLSVTLLGGRMVLDGFASEDEAMLAYRTFLVSAMAHELSHHLRLTRPGDEPTGRDLLSIEAEAEEWELAFMDDLVEHGELDAAARRMVDQLYAEVGAAIPPAAALPDDAQGEKAEEEFAHAYFAHARAIAVLQAGQGTTDPEASEKMIGGYITRRDAMEQHGHRTLDQLIQAELGFRK